MDALPRIGPWLGALFSLTPGTPEYLAVVYGIDLTVYGALARSLLIIFGRTFGLYHPAFYRWWPRLPWRSVYAVWLKISRWREQVFLIGKHGATGGFAGPLATLTRLYKPGQVLLGRAYAWGFGVLQPCGLKVERHLFMYAMTGAGKTVKLISIISCWNNSAFVIDPKAQITNALSRHDRREWYVLDPYQISAAPSASYNAFDCMKAAIKRDGEGAAVLWAMRIAQALIVSPPGSRTPYFSDTARGFLAGLILHVLTIHAEEEHHLPFVRDLIVGGYRVYGDDGKEMTKGDEAHALLLDAMRNNPAYEGTISGAASAMISASGETGGNVRSTLQQQTLWLDIPPVRAILRQTSLPLSALKTRRDVVLSFCAPVLSIREELAPLSRLLTNMIAYTFEAVREKNGQCLLVVDELPSQRNPLFEVILAVARSYGITLLGISQNIELMRQAHPNGWGTFSGEADAVYWMATNHDETAAHLSKILGRKVLIERDRDTERKSYREVAVMDTDQVKRFLSPDSGNLIVTRAGGRPLQLKNEPYFKALPVWAYVPDPDHREAILRRLSRALFDRRARKSRGKADTPSATLNASSTTTTRHPDQEVSDESHPVSH